jgi:flagellar biosynthesis anti-sigma factor FlgM
MIIRDKPNEGITRLYAQRLQAAEKPQREVAAASHDKAEQNQDKVEISAEALLLQKGVEVALSAEDVRWDKVNALRQRIARGSYEIPVKQLAQRLLGEA